MSACASRHASPPHSLACRDAHHFQKNLYNVLPPVETIIVQHHAVLWRFLLLRVSPADGEHPFIHSETAGTRGGDAGGRYQSCCRGPLLATFRKISMARNRRQWNPRSLTYRPGQARRCPGGPAHCLPVDWFQQLAHARVGCAGSGAATPDVLYYLQSHSNIVKILHDPGSDPRGCLPAGDRAAHLRCWGSCAGARRISPTVVLPRPTGH